MGTALFYYSEKAKYPANIKLTIGTTINIPSHSGLLRAAAISIHRTAKITMFTIGIKQSMSHQLGLLAIVHIRKKLAMGIQASQPFCVFVLDAIICRQSAKERHDSSV